jgi:hypothetical protein
VDRVSYGFRLKVELAGRSEKDIEYSVIQVVDSLVQVRL